MNAEFIKDSMAAVKGLAFKLKGQAVGNGIRAGFGSMWRGAEKGLSSVGQDRLLGSMLKGTTTNIAAGMTEHGGWGNVKTLFSGQNMYTGGSDVSGIVSGILSQKGASAGISKGVGRAAGTIAGGINWLAGASKPFGNYSTYNAYRALGRTGAVIGGGVALGIHNRNKRR